VRPLHEVEESVAIDVLAAGDGATCELEAHPCELLHDGIAARGPHDDFLPKRVPDGELGVTVEIDVTDAGQRLAEPLVVAAEDPVQLRVVHAAVHGDEVVVDEVPPAVKARTDGVIVEPIAVDVSGGGD
jgi:hypothetical protein